MLFYTRYCFPSHNCCVLLYVTSITVSPPPLLSICLLHVLRKPTPSPASQKNANTNPERPNDTNIFDQNQPDSTTVRRWRRTCRACSPKSARVALRPLSGRSGTRQRSGEAWTPCTLLWTFSCPTRCCNTYWFKGNDQREKRRASTIRYSSVDGAVNVCCAITALSRVWYSASVPL